MDDAVALDVSPRYFRSSAPAPTVGVVVPAHNAAAFIEQALAGVAGQSYRPAEVVVVDDASMDGTADLADSWADRLNLRVLRLRENVGSGEARRRAIAMMSTDLLAPLDADDVWMPDHLQHLVDVWRRRPAVVSARAEVWRPGEPRVDYHRALGLKVPKDNQLSALLAGNFVFFGSVFAREEYERAGGFGRHRGWEDWELWVKMAANHVPITLAEFPTVLYRRHTQNLTHNSTYFDAALLRRIEEFRQQHPEWLEGIGMGAGATVPQSDAASQPGHRQPAPTRRQRGLRAVSRRPSGRCPHGRSHRPSGRLPGPHRRPALPLTIDPLSWSFITGLPKVELHLHLEGSMRPATRARLAERHGVVLGPGAAATGFQDFDGFIEAFIEGMSLLRDAEDLVSVIVDMAADLGGQNVRYAEITTTAWAHIRGGTMSELAYAEALAEGASIARRDLDVNLAWVIDIPRGFETPEAQFTVSLLAGPNCPAGVVALGLGGPEIGYPAGPYAPSFERAAALGLGRVPHGGETGGAGYVRDCVELLGANRIGHGVMALQDPGVLQLLVGSSIPLEVCISSNVALGVCESVQSHPLGRLRDTGVTVSLATDDPGYFDTTLSDELALAHLHHGFSLEDLRDLQLETLDMSFLDATGKAKIRREILEFAARSINRSA